MNLVPGTKDKMAIFGFQKRVWWPVRLRPMSRILTVIFLLRVSYLPCFPDSNRSRFLKETPGTRESVSKQTIFLPSQLVYTPLLHVPSANQHGSKDHEMYLFAEHRTNPCSRGAFYTTNNFLR